MARSLCLFWPGAWCHVSHGVAVGGTEGAGGTGRSLCPAAGAGTRGRRVVARGRADAVAAGVGGGGGGKVSRTKGGGSR